MVVASLCSLVFRRWIALACPALSGFFPRLSEQRAVARQSLQLIPGLLRHLSSIR